MSTWPLANIEQPAIHAASSPETRWPVRLGTHGRPDFITQQLIAALNEAPKKADKISDSKIKTRYAAMVDKLVELANDGEQWAIKFIWERVEGPVTARLEPNWC